MIFDQDTQGKYLTNLQSPAAHPNFTDALGKQVLYRSESAALVTAGGQINFRQLERLVWQGAAHLYFNGVRSGDVLAFVFQKEVPLIVAMLASARLGATLISIPPLQPPMVQNEMVQRAGAKFLVSDGRPRVDLLGQLPRIDFDLSVFSKNLSPIDPSIRDPRPTSPWLIIYGSGSTGRSKLIPVSHAQFAGRMAIYNTALSISPSDRVASLFPLDFATPKQRCLEAILGGAAFVLIGSDPGKVVQHVREAGISVIYATVFHAERLLEHVPENAVETLGSLRAFLVGSSVVSSDLRARIRRRLTKNLFIYFGMNEFGLATIALPSEIDAEPETVGHVPLGVSLEVVGSDRRPLPEGEVGMLRGQSPGMCAGYLGEDSQLASSRNFSDGWFYPGDLVKITREGLLMFCGRSDYMMNMNGINIYPAEIESVITMHPSIRDAVALPLSNPVHQDIPICVVALHQGHHVEERELIDFAYQRLGSRAPRCIVVLPEIPRKEDGKPIRPLIGEAVARSLGLNGFGSS